MPSDYRFSQALAARLMGLVLAAIGLLVFLLALAVAALSLPSAVLSTGVLLAVIGVAGAGFLLSRRGFVVRLDDTGYQVRFVRGAGVSRARWREVEDVVATKVAGDPCVVMRLKDGRSTTVPVGVLAGDGNAFVRDLRAHLNRGHGYRRIG